MAIKAYRSKYTGEQIDEKLGEIRAFYKEITYNELILLVQESALVPGQQYRITDYQCTTAQENTVSAGHQFDIIVTADSESVLNENARAIQHEGDTYFANSDLSVGELKYSLDNDSSRFGGAQEGVPAVLPTGVEDNSYKYNRNTEYDILTTENISIVAGRLSIDSSAIEETLSQFYNAGFKYAGLYRTTYYDYLAYTSTLEVTVDTPFKVIDVEANTMNHSYYDKSCVNSDYQAPVAAGKGVIYWLKDEFNNECPYDFKNIQFKRKISLENGYPEYNKENGADTWVYTFTANSYHISNDEWSELKDGSLEPPYGHQSDENSSTYHDNIIQPYIKVMDSDEDYAKCGIQYLNDNVFLGYYEEVGSDNPENYPYYYGYGSYGCKLGLNNYSNTFGNNCHSNTFGNSCCGNTFEDSCQNNTFGNDCEENIFGPDYQYNVFGDYCKYNTFGNGCIHNTFGSSCTSNTFVYNCQGNTFGNHCSRNTFGDKCDDNIFGNRCRYNTFGNYCESNTFGNNCHFNTFGTSSGTIDYCRYNIIDNGCSYLYINSTDTGADDNNYLQNVHIHLGVSASSPNRLTIEVPDRNLAYEYNVVKAGTTTVEKS